MSLQLDALSTIGCDKLYTDKMSGVNADRPGLTAALNFVREGDVLIVWKLDRLGRSMPNLIETLTSLTSKKVGVRSLTENIDTTTASGRLIIHIFAALASFERDLIKERTMAGLTSAAARGRKGGRPTVITEDKLTKARIMLAEGSLTPREIAGRLKIGKTTLYKALKQDKTDA